MSKRNVVRPDHFKTAGREPIGQATAQELQKQDYRKSQVRTQRRGRDSRAPRPPQPH